MTRDVGDMTFVRRAARCAALLVMILSAHGSTMAQSTESLGTAPQGIRWEIAAGLQPMASGDESVSSARLGFRREVGTSGFALGLTVQGFRHSGRYDQGTASQPGLRQGVERTLTGMLVGERPITLSNELRFVPSIGLGVIVWESIDDRFDGASGPDSWNETSTGVLASVTTAGAGLRWRRLSLAVQVVRLGSSTHTLSRKRTLVPLLVGVNW